MRHISYCTLNALFGGIFFVASACGAPTLDEVESRVIAGRLAIKSAQIEIVDRDLQSPDYFQTRRWTIYWDEANQRLDTATDTSSGPGVQEMPTAYQYHTMSCFSGDNYYSYDKGIPNCVLTVNKRASVSKRVTMISPRDLGTNPLGISFTKDFHLRSFVGSKPRTEEAVSAGEWKGLNAWNIRYRMADGCLLNYVIVPEYGDSIVRIEERFEPEGRKQEHQIHCATMTVQKHLPSGVFFPSQIDYKGTYAGKLRYHKVADVKVISLNSPLDSDFFSPKTMNVPQGTYAMDLADRSERQKIWDGEKIVTLAGAETTSATPGGNNARRVLLICSSVLLVILSAILFLRQYRRRVYH